jgi:hypothetical protein
VKLTPHEVLSVEGIDALPLDQLHRAAASLAVAPDVLAYAPQ